MLTEEKRKNSIHLFDPKSALIIERAFYYLALGQGRGLVLQEAAGLVCPEPGVGAVCG